MKIQIVPYQVSEHYDCTPGTMCVYKGNVTSLSELQMAGGEPTATHNDLIEINSRDFLASLHRFLSIKSQEYEPRGSYTDPNTQNDLQNLMSFNNYNQLILANFLKNQDEQLEDDQEKAIAIIPQIIKCLVEMYSHKESSVRESVIHALGLLEPPPFEHEAHETLTNALSDPGEQVRVYAAWALGKLGDTTSQKVAWKLVELLKDKYWKVRTSACIALGFMGNNTPPSIFSILIKCLKEGTVNRGIVCETLVRLGVEGEQILVDLLKNAPHTDYLLKSAILQSFELVDIQDPHSDFVIEELFKFAT